MRLVSLRCRHQCSGPQSAGSDQKGARGWTWRRLIPIRDETIAIHGGYDADGTRAVAVPIYQTVAHEFTDADHAAAIFDLAEPGFHYNRINNPTVDVLERRMDALEGGVGALAVASGMAAIRYAIRNITVAGRSVVTTPQLYGATYTLFAHVLPEEGVTVRFSEDDRPESIGALIDETTAAVFCESIGNPVGNIVGLPAVCDVAHAHGVPVVVDNTVATPMTLKPFDHGADIVVHSLTKFVGGHGTTLGGMVVDGGRFPWGEHSERFPMLSRPEASFHGVVYTRDFAEKPFIVRCRTVGLRNDGATLSPFNAFLLLQGLETLSVRLERQHANTEAVARWLSEDPRVAWVSWSGFADHPHHALGLSLLGGRYPSILTFGVAGGYEAGIRFFNGVDLFTRLVNMGDAKSIVSHPASTTHRQLTPAELEAARVTPDMIRLSMGIEHIDDLIDDLDQALHTAVS
jgi:O-acetylhomoserine (thiol)-lyase